MIHQPTCKQTLSFLSSFLVLTARLALFSSPLYAELKTGMAADAVVGQPDFTSETADQGGSVNANTIHLPRNISSDPAL